LFERLALANAPAASPQSPSVLLIVLDTVRADRLGLAGYPRQTTPFLDQFAGQAVVFDRAIANSSWSLPSHISLLTGQSAENSGVTIHEGYDGRHPTIAGFLAGRGYATAAFVANSGYATCARGLGAGFLRYEDAPAPLSQLVEQTVFSSRLNRHLLSPLFNLNPPREWLYAEQINRRFLSWLGGQPGRPFFAFLNYMDAHFPYAPPAKLAEQFAGDSRLVDPKVWYPMRFGERPLEGTLVKQGSDLYDASLAYLDGQLRALFAELERRGMTKNLLVIITSDHGESFGEHGLLEHQSSLYADQLRVPLLVRLPGKTPDGARVSLPVGLNQVAATVSRLVGEDRSLFPGLPLDEFWKGNAPLDHQVYSEVAGGPWPGVSKHWPIFQGNLRSLVTDRWHLILPDHGSPELFDWSKDPHEENNLAADPALASVLADLKARLERARSAQITP
jgi:arylsulfatase A-like enzyme